MWQSQAGLPVEIPTIVTRKICVQLSSKKRKMISNNFNFNIMEKVIFTNKKNQTAKSEFLNPCTVIAIF
jgi:hypothetical protein